MGLPLYVKINNEYREVSALAVGPNIREVLQVPISSTVDQYLEIFSSRKHPKTFRNEKMFFRQLLEVIDKKHVAEVDQQDIERVKSLLLKRLKPSSIERRFDVYRNFFQKCIDWDIIQKSPFKNIKKMRLETNHFKVWNESDFDGFIRTTESPHREMFLFMWFTGCRPSEFKNLKWTDINFDERTIKLRCGKNANISRIFPMSNDVERVLHNVSFQAGNVFQFNGEPMNCDNLYQYAKHRLIALGLGHLTPYGMRHTFATRLCNQGLNAFQIQILMGHADIKTTLGYVHPERNVLIDALNAVKSFSSISANR